MQVQDILHNKHFQKAEVIAGRLGLHNVIKWVHIIEIVNVENFVKGNELVLTTGLGIQNDVDKFLHFVKGLIESIARLFVLNMGNIFNKCLMKWFNLQISMPFLSLFLKKKWPL